jgi:hypothetical protein
MAPLIIVLALAAYCCWSESHDPVVAAPKETAAKIELTPALLSPASTPVPTRDPFPAVSAKTKVLAVAPPGKESLVKIDMAKDTSHLILRATFIHGDRRMAMINSKFYGEGDTLINSPEPDSKSRPGKNKAPIPIIPFNTVKTVGQAYQVAEVLEDRVVLKHGEQTVELKFLHADRKANIAPVPIELNDVPEKLLDTEGK